MSCVIPFPIRRPATELAPPGRAAGLRPAAKRADVAGLAARLSRLERCDSADEAKMEELMDAEIAVLDALAATPSSHIGEVALKLAALLRRTEADGEGLLPDGEMALLRGALRDLRRLGRPPVAVQA